MSRLLRENMTLLGVFGTCSELQWGVSCEIADIHAMSVCLYVLERFEVFYVVSNEFVCFERF